MAQYYINAESIIQNGMTPDTGYHNFSGLIAAKGALADADVVDVIYTTTPVSQSTTVILAGTIKAHVDDTFPAIDQGDSNIPLYLKIGTTLKGLRLINNFYTWTYGYTALAPYNPSSIVGPITIDSCKFEHVGTYTIQIFNTHPAYIGSGFCSNPIIKNCTCWNMAGATFYNNTGTYDASWNPVIVNCCFVERVKNNGFISVYDMTMYAYNNAFKCIDPYMWAFVSVTESTPGKITTLGEVDYFKTNASGYFYQNPPPYYVRGPINLGANFFLNAGTMFPAETTSNKDFQLAASSSLVDAGVSNVYTPADDITGRSRDLTIDIGAYEYTPNAYVTVLLPAVITASILNLPMIVLPDSAAVIASGLSANASGAANSAPDSTGVIASSFSADAFGEANATPSFADIITSGLSAGISGIANLISGLVDIIVSGLSANASGAANSAPDSSGITTSVLPVDVSESVTLSQSPVAVIASVSSAGVSGAANVTPDSFGFVASGLLAGVYGAANSAPDSSGITASVLSVDVILGVVVSPDVCTVEVIFFSVVIYTTTRYTVTVSTAASLTNLIPFVDAVDIMAVNLVAQSEAATRAYTPKSCERPAPNNGGW